MGHWNDRYDTYDLINAYDAYIQTANEADLFRSGWRPVCFAEFAESEYQDVWKGSTKGNPFDYMFDE